MPINAKIFTNGRNQAVRIPRELEFKGVDAVTIEKQGNSLLLRPIRNTWSSLQDEGRADEDFMRIRPRLLKST
ncbi:MAG: AbrB/MazE/SpoVT family DNA-binding domain-containing protein [SAR86 cluster bacterium]|uniref:AbrB/MazE/SpoVT family DNA-binding domain-containing protein n=1 Tax=SAR86 cluster bacterium TaxID=2030880 RepID=A0A2A5C8X6_9GAMM|nr:MAG: AbrB/MazE/SpoVT family DNA-binding domain-containing protein [SAR86 cluster bacterium]